jgi:DNA-binding MarR family transcriptional regulator
MKLEEALKQTKPFQSEIQKLVLNITYTSSYLNARLAEKLKPFGITPHQYNVLRILKGSHPGGYCNQEITERMIDKSSNSTRIVDKLVEKELVSRSEHPEDRRLVDIRITAAGLSLLKEIEKIPKSFSNLYAFNEQKAKLMNEWLDELRG